MMSDLLFRYFGTHGIETLRDRALMVSKISAFNDVFECAYQVVGEITETSCKDWIRSRLNAPEFLDKILAVRPNLRDRKMARREVKRNLPFWVQHFLSNKHAVVGGLIKERERLMDESMRVASFSAYSVEPHHEVLIWSHYSQRHTGMRIGFKFPDLPQLFALRPMDYSMQRAPYNVSKNPFDERASKQMEAILYTKSGAWRYEQEVRLVTAHARCTQRGDPVRDFVLFDPSWVQRVDFGVRFDVAERTRAIRELLNAYPHVSWFQAVLHERDYAFNYVPISVA